MFGLFQYLMKVCLFYSFFFYYNFQVYISVMVIRLNLICKVGFFAFCLAYYASIHFV